MTVVLAHMRDHGDDMHRAGGHWWWWVIALVVLVLLIVAIVALFQRQPVAESSAPTVVPARSPAEVLLAERLARGEIDADEYRRRRDALRE
jgi:putative membrane protein